MMHLKRTKKIELAALCVVSVLLVVVFIVAALNVGH